MADRSEAASCLGFGWSCALHLWKLCQGARENLWSRCSWREAVCLGSKLWLRCATALLSASTVPVTVPPSAMDAQLSAWNSAIRCDPYMFLTYFTVTLRTTDKTDIISWRASAGIKRKWQFGSSHSRTQVACFRNSNLVCRYIDILIYHSRSSKI